MAHTPSLRFISRLASSVLVLFLCFPPATAWTQEIRLFRIGTGGLMGVYHPLGQALAEGITTTTALPELIAVAQTSGGSVENVRALLSGEIEAGLVQADVALWALQGQGPFVGDDRGRHVRAVASLYPERLQIVTRRDADIRTIADLRGKSISLDEAGSGTLAVMRIVLEDQGLSEKDLSPVYLKPEFTTEKFIAGGLNGFCLMAGTPAQAITTVIDQDLFMVPVAPEIATRISRRHPYLVPGMIPADSYEGVPETATIEVHALLLVHEDLDEALVYEMTATLWSEQTQFLLRQAHPQSRSVTLDTALHGLSVPLHPGARRFYQEQDMLPLETSAP